MFFFNINYVEVSQRVWSSTTPLLWEKCQAAETLLVNAGGLSQDKISTPEVSGCDDAAGVIARLIRSPFLPNPKP